MQIMGLLLLRDDALEKMQDFMFPTVAKSKGRLLTAAMTTMPQVTNTTTNQSIKKAKKPAL